MFDYNWATSSTERPVNSAMSVFLNPLIFIILPQRVRFPAPFFALCNQLTQDTFCFGHQAAKATGNENDSASSSVTTPSSMAQTKDCSAAFLALKAASAWVLPYTGFLQKRYFALSTWLTTIATVWMIYTFCIATIATAAAQAPPDEPEPPHPLTLRLSLREAITWPIDPVTGLGVGLDYALTPTWGLHAEGVVFKGKDFTSFLLPLTVRAFVPLSPGLDLFMGAGGFVSLYQNESQGGLLGEMGLHFKFTPALGLTLGWDYGHTLGGYPTGTFSLWGGMSITP